VISIIKPIILGIDDSKSLVKKKYLRCETDGFVKVVLPNKKRCIRKVLRGINSENILIEKESAKNSVLSGQVYNYKKVSMELIKVIIEQVCILAAKKYSIRLPLKEIFIEATTYDACSLILPLVNISRLFTIVSNEFDVKKADEMYFKYGCIIRKKEKICFDASGDRIAICVDSVSDFIHCNLPVINLSEEAIEKNNVVNIRRIKVFDSRISALVKLWGGEPGLELYNATELIPDDTTIVDLNVNADKIFLLDIGQL